MKGEGFLTLFFGVGQTRRQIYWHYIIMHTCPKVKLCDIEKAKEACKMLGKVYRPFC